MSKISGAESETVTCDGKVDVVTSELVVTNMSIINGNDLDSAIVMYLVVDALFTDLEILDNFG